MFLVRHYILYPSLCKLGGHFSLEPFYKIFQFHGTGIGTFPSDRNRAVSYFLLSYDSQHRYTQQRNLAYPLAERFVSVIYGGANIGIIQQTANCFCKI